jgi:hypothetical protein
MIKATHNIAHPARPVNSCHGSCKNVYVARQNLLVSLFWIVTKHACVHAVRLVIAVLAEAHSRLEYART